MLKRLCGLALVVLLAASACSRSQPASTRREPAATSGSTTSVPTARAASALGPRDFGTLKAVCGGGSAKGTTAQGVTNTSIDVGTMADPGASTSPGLGQELFDTAAAFVRWCNDAGGILGRKIVLHLRDAKLFEVPARTLEACGQDFVEVGSGTAFDDAGVAPRLKCGLPEIPAYDNSPAATEAPLKVQGDPLPVEQETAAPFAGAKRLFPADTRVGFVTGQVAGILVNRDRLEEAAAAEGFTAVYSDTFPITGVDDWRPLVQKMRDSGVQVLSLIGDTAALVGMERSMKQVGWYPDAIVESAIQYDRRVIQDGGDAIAHTWVVDSYYPFEEAKDNPATQQYLDIMAEEDAGARIAPLGRNAWSAWLLFATAARDCGSDLTRDCLLQRAGAHAAWTAGGLKAPSNTDPNDRQMTSCYLAMKGTPAGWQRDPAFLVPNHGIYDCDPANVVYLKGDYRPRA